MSSDDESSYDSSSLRWRIRSALDRVRVRGSYATSSVFEDAVSPGLWIEGIGNVGLPLSDRDAKAIISVAHKAPFGRGKWD